MTLLSSFELLFEPITPKVQPPINPSPSVPDPVVVQAYFVLISNVGGTDASLTLEFNSTPNSTLTIKDTLAIFDIENKGFTTLPVTAFDPKPPFIKTKAHLPLLKAGQTGIFLLQPNIANLLSTLGTPPDITKTKFGFRGYVNVSSDTHSQFLISPQTRGTFLDASTPPNLKVVSQEAFSLPTAGSNLFTFP